MLDVNDARDRAIERIQRDGRLHDLSRYHITIERDGAAYVVRFAVSDPDWLGGGAEVSVMAQSGAVAKVEYQQ